VSESASVKRTKWAWVAGTFFGAGNLKPGPGTWGSLAATLLWTFFLHFHAYDLFGRVVVLNPRLSPLWLSLIGALLATLIGIPAATIVARESGRKDPQNVVIDEVAGQWLTLTAAAPDWKHALAGLALFRLFDIAKPWPARQLERLPEGWGIMLDDLAAGLYGAIVLLLLRPWW
jgi:phosphatidylglycerophosphatase A